MKKTLAMNAFYNVLYRVLNLLFPLVTTTYIARILLPEGVGKVTIALNIVQYFVIVAGLGIPNYGIREIAKVRIDRESENKVFSELFFLNALSTSICLVTYFSIIIRFGYFQRDEDLYFVSGLLLIFNYINVDWFYQGNEEYKYIAVRNTVVKIISVVLLIIFIKEPRDYLKYTLIYCLALGGNYILNVFNLRGKVTLVYKGLDIRRHLKPVMVLLASTISIELYTMVDVTMLGALCEECVVGYYNNASKFARMINSLIASIGAVLLPRLSFYYTHNKESEFSNTIKTVRDVLLYLTIPAVVGVMLLSEDIIVVLFGRAFQPASLTLAIMSVLIFAVVFNNLYGTQILITIGQEKELLRSVITGAAVNIVLNSVLIPYAGHNGAAVASVTSELVVWICTRHFALRYVEIRYEKKFVASIVGSSVALGIAVTLLKHLNFSMFAELVVSVITGIIVYMAATTVSNNRVTLLAINKLRKKDKNENSCNNSI